MQSHLAIDDQNTRRLARDLVAYLKHLGDDIEHTDPSAIEPGYFAILPGVGAMSAAVVPAREHVDPQTGARQWMPRNLFPQFFWEQDEQQNLDHSRWSDTYFARWLRENDPQAAGLVFAFADMLKANLRCEQDVSVAVYGLGVFASAGSFKAFSISPEFMNAANSGHPQVASDADLRVPAQLCSGLPDDHLCVATIDHLWHSLPPHPEGIDRMFGNRITTGQKYVYAIGLVCREIAQNGMAHMLCTPAGDLAGVALEALAAADAGSYEVALGRVLALFGPDFPIDVRQRTQILERADQATIDEIERCSDQFMALLNGPEPIYQQVAAFIRHNPAHFFRAA